MARLRREGWFESSKVGRQSRYMLTDEGWRLLDTGRERIFERPPEPWPGQWCLAIYSVPESARASRDRLRKTLTWLGFGPLAASAWVSPHDRRDQVAEAWKGEPDGRLQLLMAQLRRPRRGPGDGRPLLGPRPASTTPTPSSWPPGSRR